MIDKILGVVTIGTSLASARLLHRFLIGMTKLVVLAIVSAFIICALLTGVFAAAYFGLVQYGLDPHMAASLLGVVFLGILILLSLGVRAQMRQIRTLSCAGSSKGENLWLDIGNIANAFVEGFRETKK